MGSSPLSSSPLQGIEAGVEWLRRQGHRVTSSENACWYDAAPGVLQAFPYHPTITLSDEELFRTLRRTRAFAMRYSTPVTSPVGKISYHIVCDCPAYQLDCVSRQTRQNVRKALACVRIEPLSFDSLAREGWTMRAETLARQGRPRAETQAWWTKLCLSAAGLPGFEAWGAFHEGRLVASLVAYLARGTFLMLYQQSLTEFLRLGVNNALGFVFTQSALAKPGVRQLSYGLESLDASWTVDEFKLRMGYKALPVRQRVYFHPGLRPFISGGSLAAVEYLGRNVLKSPLWAKAAGLMRFYLQGNLPLSRQRCPECLSGVAGGPRPEHGEKRS